jgi:hypothetical protein
MFSEAALFVMGTWVSRGVLGMYVCTYQCELGKSGDGGFGSLLTVLPVYIGRVSARKAGGPVGVGPLRRNSKFKTKQRSESFFF